MENLQNKSRVDHIDRDKTNNKISNLRWVTHSENNMNRSIRSDNISGVPGINWYKKLSKWHVQISINGEQKHIGYFNDFEDAITARQYAQHVHHGEYANIINIQNATINNYNQ